jgi:hypothetical protein
LENYRFYEGGLPSDYTLVFEESLFNLQGFYSLQDPADWVSFYILGSGKKKVLAGVHFHITDQLASSPYRAPFGSVEFAKQLPPRVLYDFFEYVEVQLEKREVGEVLIKNPPQAYDPASISLIETFLLNKGYQIASAEVSALLKVNDSLFSARIRNSEKLRLQQAKNAGCVFVHWENERLQQVYDFLSRCHDEKGYLVSMALPDLQKVFVQFPDRYLLFGIMKEGEIIAASVTIKVNEKCLYNFFTNHDRKYNTLSPLILLIEGIYTYCQENKTGMFDLGTSALQGQPNFNLLDFKMHIGGIPSAKLTFKKNLG